MLERVVYVSRAAAGIGMTDAYDIIRVAHNRNSSFGLTGALLFSDGWFVQVLEGESFCVRERYARIASDPRHEQVDLRQQITIEEPAFPGEWMALKSGSDVDGALKVEFGYEPGFPAERFDGERLHAFMLACWHTANRAIS
jgi:Sensors of blue-light using FAD